VLLYANLDIKGLANPASIALNSFNTLSYTWGNPEKNGLLTIDGHKFPVTENLQAALRYMRNFKDSKVDNTPIRSFLVD